MKYWQPACPSLPSSSAPTGSPGGSALLRGCTGSHRHLLLDIVPLKVHRSPKPQVVNSELSQAHRNSYCGALNANCSGSHGHNLFSFEEIDIEILHTSHQQRILLVFLQASLHPCFHFLLLSKRFLPIWTRNQSCCDICCRSCLKVPQMK